MLRTAPAWFAPLRVFYVSPTQINLEIPAGTAPGVAAVMVSSDGPPVSGTALVRNVVPAIFSQIRPVQFPPGLTQSPTDPITSRSHQSW